MDHYCHKVFLSFTNVNSFEILILYRIFISFSKFERYWRRVFEVKLPFLCPVWSERSVIKMREKGISFKPSGSWILLHTQPFCAISRACMGRGVDLGGKNGEQYNNARDLTSNWVRLPTSQTNRNVTLSFGMISRTEIKAKPRKTKNYFLYISQPSCH